MTANPFQMRADRALVERMLAGDERAFEEFFDDYFDGIYRFALTRLRHDETLSAEIAQATLCKAIEKLDTYRAEAALFTWLCTVCRYEISAHFRRQRRMPEEVELVEDTVDVRAALDGMAARPEDPEEILRREELGRLVHAALDHLPARYGQALEWKYLDGLSVREIAERLGLQPKAAESVLTRARQAFRQGFEALTRPPIAPLTSHPRTSP